MSPTMALERSEVHVGQVISFPAASTEHHLSRLLSAVAGQVVRTISSVLEDLVLSVLEKRTAAEFQAKRQEVFPKYFEAMHALSTLTGIVIPDDQILDRVSNEFFCEMEAVARDQAVEVFGSDVRDQLMFTIWTLRKTTDLSRQILAAPLSPEKQEANSEFSSSYAQTAIWTRFHLDCILKSIELRRPLHPEVHELVRDGLRAAVNAYTWARRGLDLRLPENDADPPAVEWDDEEQRLLDEATHDLVSEA